MNTSGFQPDQKYMPASARILNLIHVNVERDPRPEKKKRISVNHASYTDSLVPRLTYRILAYVSETGDETTSYHLFCSYDIIYQCKPFTM